LFNNSKFDVSSKARYNNLNNMKFFSKRTEILIIAVGILFILSLNFFQKDVKNFFYSTSQPLQEWLWRKGSATSNFFEAILESENLEKENKNLKLRNQELLSKIIELEELKKENEILRTALDLGLKEEFELKMAQLIGRDISKSSLIINKGSRQGVVFGQPIITQQKSLVGKVNQVYENVSKIQLLTSKNSSFDVEIFEKGIYSLAKGKGGSKLLLELIPPEKGIEIGDKVITSALGGNFPQGLLVGEVQNIKKTDIAHFQEAEIRPIFNVEELDYLFIITDFTLSL